MAVMKNHLIACVLIAVPALAHAGAPSEAERYARRCQSLAGQRIAKPQGTMLWGTKRSWDTEKSSPESNSVLTSMALEPLRQADAGVKALRLEGGHLAAQRTSQAEPGAPASQGVVGTVLQGFDSEGKPVEVAICGAEPSPEDPSMAWYRVQAWNSIAQEWENPCVALDNVPDPRALVVDSLWDEHGGGKRVPGRFTFACENGAIAKCISWGYKPWAQRDGKPLTELHQACTRMARADYCGNGRSHTHQDTTIDIYDRMGVLARTVEATAEWDPAKGAFEAAWAPDGATCLARSRDGRALETILQECPTRFRQGAPLSLGEGEHCVAHRDNVRSETALLRNQSYPVATGTASADSP